MAARNPPEEDIKQSRVAVVIVNYRTPELTQRCLASLEAERGELPNLRAVVVDGGSDDDSADQLGTLIASPGYKDWVTFLPQSINGGFGWANNQAILFLARAANPPEFIHFLNPDAVIRPGAVAALVRDLRANTAAGAAGSQMIDHAGTELPSAFRFPSVARELVRGAQSEQLRRLFRISPIVIDQPTSEVDWVSGASFMIRTSAIKESGLFDDGFFLYFEEVELMHRLRRRGWTVRLVPSSRVLHIEGGSTGIATRRHLPGYWYASRRRYFALTGGRSAVLRGNIACLAGLAAKKAKAPLGRSLNGPSLRASDVLSSWPRKSDAIPSAPAWGDEPGKEPFWMSDRDRN